MYYWKKWEDSIERIKRSSHPLRLRPPIRYYALTSNEIIIVITERSLRSRSVESRWIREIVSQRLVSDSGALVSCSNLLVSNVDRFAITRYRRANDWKIKRNEKADHRLNPLKLRSITSSVSLIGENHRDLAMFIGSLRDDISRDGGAKVWKFRVARSKAAIGNARSNERSWVLDKFKDPFVADNG